MWRKLLYSGFSIIRQRLLLGTVRALLLFFWGGGLFSGLGLFCFLVGWLPFAGCVRDVCGKLCALHIVPICLITLRANLCGSQGACASLVLSSPLWCAGKHARLRSGYHTLYYYYYYYICPATTHYAIAPPPLFTTAPTPEL